MEGQKNKHALIGVVVAIGGGDCSSVGDVDLTTSDAL